MTLNKKSKDSPVQENKKAQEVSKESAKDVTIRVWRVLVAASIAYAIVVIVMGTEGVIPKIALIPAALYGAFLLIKR